MQQQQQQQQQQQARALNETWITAPKGPFDPGRMHLTDAEREWAKEIKAAALSCPELDPISDFMYAQYAVVTLITESDNGVNKEAILERMRTHQNFRKEHNFPDKSCSAHSFRILTRLFNDLIPGHFLSFSYYMRECSYEITLDTATFNRRILADPEALRTFLAGNWILMEAQQPDFHAMRRGVTYLMDTATYDWRNPDMLNRNVVQYNSSPESLSYPLHVRVMKIYNVGMFANLCWSMIKKVLPSHITRTVNVHCRSPVGRLRDLFLVPTVEAANEKNLKLIMNALERRSRNEESFRLE